MGIYKSGTEYAVVFLYILHAMIRRCRIDNFNDGSVVFGNEDALFYGWLTDGKNIIGGEFFHL